MNINLELYRTFYVVANAGNITKASDTLHMTQPAVTQAIKKLEESLNGTLFIRTKRGVILTEEGKEFYKYIKQAMDFIDSAENKFTELVNLELGTIRIGISTTLAKEFLLPYLKTFHKNHPQIKIDILTYMTIELMPMLQNGLVDIIIMHIPFKPFDGVEIIKCKNVTDAFVVSDAYKHLVGKKIHISELNNYPLILQSSPSNTRYFLDEFARKNDVILNPSMNLASYNLVVAFTKIGLGIGYATKDYIKDLLEDKILYELEVVPKIPSRSIGLAIKKNSKPSFATQKLIQLIVPNIKFN